MLGKIEGGRRRGQQRMSQKKVFWRKLRKLFLYKFAVAVSCNDKDIFLRNDLSKPVVGALYESLAGVGNVKELFWLCVSADRPDADSVSSRHDDAIAMLSVHSVIINI